MIARVIAEEFAVSYHPGHVRKVLKAMGFSVQRPRRQLAKADPVEQDRWQRYTYPRLKETAHHHRPQEYCGQLGIEYLVLKRTPAPGLPPRTSTDLRGF